MGGDIVPIFYLQAETAEASGIPCGETRKQFRVFMGSTAMKSGSPRVKREQALTNKLIAEGVLVDDVRPDLYRFAQDYEFTSASAAGGVIKDGNCSGREAWKSEQGETLKTFLAAYSGENVDIEALETAQTETKSSVSVHGNMTTNLILYGPPGTGKTYQTALEAVSLCIGEAQARELASQGRAELMNEYKQLVAAGQIEFVTFHQSFSYEEFVEGLRPSTESNQIGEDTASAGFSLEPHDGAFKRISERARLDKGDENGDGRLSRRSRIYKIHLPTGAEGQKRLQFMLDDNVIFTDVGGDIDWSDDAYDMDRDTPFNG
ncbi:DUF4357 domain-containing protein [Roseibium sp. RKSG952]|uniref:DUF4357 domain-containing protein n=1 Tax=Roseibium sp. RKSG952 TaxID=2529384 RepID=UPI0012BCACBB|nr:DUF4357 domain-containing protein [Roseibium sp. RKSG952]MTH94750.1 DUF4357 domain-containing protein [Roseibium sp. RKSG952]